MSCPTTTGHTLQTLQSHTDVPGFAEIRELLKCLAESPHIGIAVLDSRFRYVSINPAMALMNGASVDFHAGKAVRQVLGQAGRELEPRLARVFETGESVRFELTAHLPKRSEVARWKVMYLPIRNLLGKVEQICAVVTEIEQDRALELSLFGLSRKLLTLHAMVNGNKALLLGRGGEANGKNGHLAKIVVDLLNWCVFEVVGISKMAHSPLKEITQGILNQYQSSYQEPSELPATRRNSANCLTARELEIVRHLAEGKCNKEIASALALSVRTVEHYRTNAMSKLDAHSLIDLIRFAARHNIISIR
jgi:DNA-binding CsgD family transcriptional regulator